ncbi:MAG: hypothetical protein MJY69_08840 [Bacteroidales bacterium]|nr:hypothetical protein [Bacteroidales bacterium]
MLNQVQHDVRRFQHDAFPVITDLIRDLLLPSRQLPANRLPREDGSGGVPGHSIVEGVGLKLTPSTRFPARLHRMPFTVEGDLQEVIRLCSSTQIIHETGHIYG